jgi:hypothetical protein
MILLSCSFHSGAVVNGVPVVCGGKGTAGTARVDCYEYDSSSKIWLRVSQHFFTTTGIMAQAFVLPQP